MLVTCSSECQLIIINQLLPILFEPCTFCVCFIICLSPPWKYFTIQSWPIIFPNLKQTQHIVSNHYRNKYLLLQDNIQLHIHIFALNIRHINVFLSRSKMFWALVVLDHSIFQYSFSPPPAFFFLCFPHILWFPISPFWLTICGTQLTPRSSPLFFPYMIAVSAIPTLLSSTT